MKNITVAIHDGIFHTDDVFAIAILRKIYPDLKLIRTRDEEVLKSVDMRVDIGKKYNPKTGDFDHHQDESILRKDGLAYAACGLIWKHFGKKIVDNEAGLNYIDKNLIEFIDASDNGVNFSNNVVSIYSVVNIIDSFNPAWDEKKSDNQCFDDAVAFATKIFDRELARANLIDEGIKMVKEALKNAEKEFVVLPRPGLPKDLIRANKNMKFSIFPHKKGHWIAVSITVEKDSFECRKCFPKSWAGLEGVELEKVSGVTGAIFCHKHRFMISTKTKEQAVEMVRRALKE
jgi:uncharacterized UPF0160 family protein